MSACRNGFTQLLKGLHLIFISRFRSEGPILDSNIKSCKHGLIPDVQSDQNSQITASNRLRSGSKATTVDRSPLIAPARSSWFVKRTTCATLRLLRAEPNQLQNRVNTW